MKYFALVLLVVSQFGCATHSTRDESTPSSAREAVVTPAPAPAPVEAKPAAAGLASDAKAVAPADWSGACRKVVNETNKPIKGKEGERLQSRYQFADRELTWSVLSFNDKTCKRAVSGDRYMFACNADPLKTSARCTQSSQQVWAGGKWKPSAMKDSPMQITYLASKKGAVLELSSVGESGDTTVEKLRQ